MPIWQFKFTLSLFRHVVEFLRFAPGSDRHVLEYKPFGISVILPEPVKQKIDGLYKDTAPILTIYDEVVNWITLYPIVGTNLDKKDFSLFANSF